MVKTTVVTTRMKSTALLATIWTSAQEIMVVEQGSSPKTLRMSLEQRSLVAQRQFQVYDKNGSAFEYLYAYLTHFFLMFFLQHFIIFLGYIKIKIKDWSQEKLWTYTLIALNQNGFFKSGVVKLGKITKCRRSRMVDPRFLPLRVWFFTTSPLVNSLSFGN